MRVSFISILSSAEKSSADSNRVANSSKTSATVVFRTMLGSEIENDAGTLYSYDIVIDNIDSGKEIYSLNVRQYVSKEVQ